MRTVRSPANPRNAAAGNPGSAPFPRVFAPKWLVSGAAIPEHAWAWLALADPILSGRHPVSQALGLRLAGLAARRTLMLRHHGEDLDTLYDRFLASGASSDLAGDLGTATLTGWRCFASQPVASASGAGGGTADPIGQAIAAARRAFENSDEDSRQIAIETAQAFDLQLAVACRWARPMPLLLDALSFAATRTEGRRTQASDPGFGQAVGIALSAALRSHLETANLLSAAAERLWSAAGSLRSAHATAGLEVITREPRFTARSLATATGMSRFAALRLVDQLAGRGLITEMSGRSEFRIYGLLR